MPFDSLPRTNPLNCAPLKISRGQPRTCEEGSKNMGSSTPMECVQNVSSHSTGVKGRPECVSGTTQFDAFYMGMTRKEEKSVSINVNNGTASSHTNTADRITKCKQKLRRNFPSGNTWRAEFKSQINWRAIDTRTRTDKHDLQRTNSVEIQLHHDRKMRRNTHPRRTQLNASRSQKERRKTVGLPDSSVKMKHVLETGRRWKMRQIIEPNVFQPLVEHE